MSYVSAAPDMLAASAEDVAGIGSSLSEAKAAATASTTRVIAAGSDEVSAAIASLFASHAKAFQAISAQGSGVSFPVRAGLAARRALWPPTAAQR
jgi:PE family